MTADPPPSRPIVIVDTETSGLYPELGHQIWDLAILDYGADGSRREHQWFIQPDLRRADPGALAVGGYYERTAGLVPVREHDPAGENGRWWSSPAQVAAKVAVLLDGATPLIAVPTFDIPFLRAFLLEHGQILTAHYRARDIGSMAYGYLHGRKAAGESLCCIPDMDAGTDDFAVALGVDPGRFERHAALGDCRLVEAMLDVMTGVPKP
jgi:DNA polymerase III epsilon subunit-like protein